jgi:hypothetical protein
MGDRQRLNRSVVLRNLALAGFAGIAVACGDADDTDAVGGGAGQGSVAPPASAAGQGGSSAQAGSSGTATGTAGTSSGGSGGSAGSSGSSGSGAAGQTAMGGAGESAAGAGEGGAAGTTPAGDLDPFSFFVTSYAAIQRLSGSADGFGGDLRYGEADGLSGADKICSEIAESSMPGSGAKVWRAFLSVTRGPDGNPVHAIDRVGEGPWYDRIGRLVAMNKTDLANTRPVGADPAIADDFPNEDGIPNHAPDGEEVDNHDMLTGTNDQGQLFSSDWAFTCHDWTSAVGRDGTPRVGHAWPRTDGPGGGGPGGGWPGFPMGGTGGGGMMFDTANWMSALTEAGCAPGASLLEMGPPDPNTPTVGSGGGYGGFYCFALSP